MKARVINLFLQGTTLASRFLFIFFLAKYLAPAEVGYFGLFAAAIGYSLYLVGIDFYIYVAREIIKTPSTERGKILKQQGALTGILYFIFAPLLFSLLYFYSNWPFYLLTWFFPILILEHFNQEMSRLLVALSEQITASLILFVRQGVWSVSVVAFMYWHESNRNLATVMSLWLLTGICAMSIGLLKLHRLGFGGWKIPIDWIWIKRGIVISAVFLLATLALRGMQTIDRFWLEQIDGIDTVGAYVLFTGVAGSLLAFLDAGVFSFAYPELIKLSKANQFEHARQCINKMTRLTILITLVFSVISWLVLPFLLQWIGKNAYTSALDFYPWVLLAASLNALGLVPHYVLYAAGQDRGIIISHVVAFLIFCLAVFAFESQSGSLAIPQSLAVSFLFILIMKYGYYKKYLSSLPSSTDLHRHRV